MFLQQNGTFCHCSIRSTSLPTSVTKYIYWRYLKILFSKITSPISTKLGTKYSVLKEIWICSNEGTYLFQRRDIRIQTYIPFFKGEILKYRQHLSKYWRSESRALIILCCLLLFVQFQNISLIKGLTISDEGCA